MVYMENQKQVRLSGVELFKIIAIVLICISHAVQTSETLFPLVPSLDGTIIALRLLRYSGMIGNTIFVTCSCWFLLDSKRAKLDKIINLLLDSVFISIIILCGMLIGGYSFEWTEIVHQILPDLFATMWFVPFYVMLYAFHPLLNLGVEKMSRKTYLGVLVILLGLFVVIRLIVDLPEICNLIYAFALYFCIGFFKKYHLDFCNNKKVNLIIFIVGFILFYLFAAGLFILASKVNLHNREDLNYAVSLLVGIPIFGGFNVFRNMNFRSRFINLISSCSLFIYCIHENILLRTYIRPDVLNKCLETFGADSAVLWILGVALIMFIGGSILALIYKYSIHYGTHWLSNKINDLYNKFINKLDKKIYKEQ